MPFPNLLEEEQKKYGFGAMEPQIPSTDLNFLEGSEITPSISPITPIKPLAKPSSIQTALPPDARQKLYDSLLSKYEEINKKASDDFASEKELTKDAQMWNEIGRAAAKGGNAYAESVGGDKFDTSGFDRIGNNLDKRLTLADKERKDAVENYLMGEKIKGSREMAKSDSDINKQMNDPNSALSIRARQLAKAMNPEIGVPDNMTGAEVDKLLPYDQKMYQVREGGFTQFRDMLLDKEKFNAQLESQRSLNESRLGADRYDSDRKYNLDVMKLNAEQDKTRNAPTKAQQAVDNKYAGDYVYWTKEGRPLAEEAIRELEAGKENLRRLQKEGKWISGKGVGYLPEVLKSQEVNDVKARLEDSAVKGLKAMLSGTTSDRDILTAKETIFNPRGSVESNISRIDSEIRKIKAKADSNNRMAEEYESKGSLKDFSGAGGSSSTNKGNKPSWAE